MFGLETDLFCIFLRTLRSHNDSDSAFFQDAMDLTSKIGSPHALQFRDAVDKTPWLKQLGNILRCMLRKRLMVLNQGSWMSKVEMIKISADVM